MRFAACHCRPLAVSNPLSWVAQHDLARVTLDLEIASYVHEGIAIDTAQIVPDFLLVCVDV